MKKFLLTIVCVVMILSSSVEAKNIRVKSLDDFSTLNPASTYRVQTLEAFLIDDLTMVYTGTIIEGTAIRVQHPKKGKRDSYFEIIPTSFTYKDETKTIERSKVMLKVMGHDKPAPILVAGRVARTAVGFVVIGATQGISFVQGVAEAENGKRIKTGLTKIYKDSPISFIEQGSELNIKTGDTVFLMIKNINNKN